MTSSINAKSCRIYTIFRLIPRGIPCFSLVRIREPIEIRGDKEGVGRERGSMRWAERREGGERDREDCGKRREGGNVGRWVEGGEEDVIEIEKVGERK